jgi:hypothetical protein
VTATGLLLFHLRFVARRYRPDRPQIWHLAARDKPPQKIPELIADLEQRTRRKFSPLPTTSRRKSEIDCPSTQLTPLLTHFRRPRSPRAAQHRRTRAQSRGSSVHIRSVVNGRLSVRPPGHEQEARPGPCIVHRHRATRSKNGDL